MRSLPSKSVPSMLHVVIFWFSWLGMLYFIQIRRQNCYFSMKLWYVYMHVDSIFLILLFMINACNLCVITICVLLQNIRVWFFRRLWVFCMYFSSATIRPQQLQGWNGEFKTRTYLAYIASHCDTVEKWSILVGFLLKKPCGDIHIYRMTSH